MESKVLNNDNYQLGGGNLATILSCPQPQLLLDYNYQPGDLSGISNCLDENSQQLVLLAKNNKSSVPQQKLEYSEVQRNARKRPIDHQAMDRMEMLKKNRKSKTPYSEPKPQLHDQPKEASSNILQLVPGRRSHKFCDKITSLQKLVSPYGKTDTASVLQEASLYIKLLQEQIQNLLRMLSNSYKHARALDLQEFRMEQQDLRSRGLCLVPISITKKITMEEDQLIQSEAMISRKSIIPRKYA
ncbi:Transcription factor protein [Quillaja saponaria]|nr:Transcription factor protein [Quillaja saponaria]